MRKYLFTAVLFLLALATQAQQRNLRAPLAKPDNPDMLDMPRSAPGALTTTTQKKRVVTIDNKVWRIVRTVVKDAQGDVVSTQNNTLDEKGRYTEKESRRYTDGKLTYGYKYTYAYDDNGNETRSEDYNLDADNDKWLLTQTDEKTYDGRGNITSETIFNYDGNSQQASSGSKWEYDTNEYGQTLLYAYYDYDVENGKWLGVSRETYVYDYYGNICEQTSLSGWCDEGWADGSKSVTRYNYKNGKKFSLAVNGYYMWESDKQDWKIIGELSYDYDEYDRVLNYKELHQDPRGFIWGYWTHYEYIQPEYAKRTRYSWDDDLQNWLPYCYYIDTYDENKCLVHTDTYDAADNSLTYQTDNTWRQFILDPTIYPDVYFVGESTSWEFLDTMTGTDLGDGIVEWRNVTIKKGEQFKFAAGSWDINWGLSLRDDSPAPVNKEVQLERNGYNITVQMDAEETTFTSIRLNIVKGTLFLETAATGVSEIDASNAEIAVSGNRIRVTGAKQVAVYNASGALVGNTAETTVEPGVYMVKADGKTAKVAVK